MGRYDSLTEQIKAAVVDCVKSWDENPNPTSKVVEKQRVYFWIRLFIKDEIQDLQEGDDILIKWEPSGEELESKFICFGKKGLNKDYTDQILQYDAEDDRKILCLMIDIDQVNYNESIPFIRTLFKSSIHYEYQAYRRVDLPFINKRTGENIEYFDCDF